MHRGIPVSWSRLAGAHRDMGKFRSTLIELLSRAEQRQQRLSPGRPQDPELLHLVFLRPASDQWAPSEHPYGGRGKAYCGDACVKTIADDLTKMSSNRY